MAQPTEQVEEAAPEENPYAGAVIEENPYAQSSTDNQSVYGTPYNGYGTRNEGNTQNFYRFSSGSSGNPPEYEEEKKPKIPFIFKTKFQFRNDKTFLYPLNDEI